MLIAIASIVPTMFLFTWPAWLIGLFRGQSGTRPPLTPSWIVTRPARRWLGFAIPGAVGMFVLGAMIIMDPNVIRGAASVVISLTCFAVSQYCAFWIGHTHGQAAKRSRARKAAAGAVAVTPAWAAEPVVQDDEGPLGLPERSLHSFGQPKGPSALS